MMGTDDFDGDDDDELLFADESEDGDEPDGASSSGRSAAPTGVKARPWKIMIVDDDREVHAVTKVVLGDFMFDGRPVEFVNAYSAVEACKAIAEHPDTAVVLLDVVMETDDAENSQKAEAITPVSERRAVG
jgi:hypothetical protein